METPEVNHGALVTPEVDAKQHGEHPTKKSHPKPKKGHPKKTEALADETIEIDTGDKKQYERVVLPETEDDPHWDPKLRNPVPEGLIDGLAEFGWDRSSQAVAIRMPDDGLKIIHGKTRWRAIEKANKLRRAAGLDPVVAVLSVRDEDPADDAAVISGMRLNVRLNRHVQDMDPMTLAESIMRTLSAGIEERQVAKDHAVTVNDLHGYLLLTDEDKCPVSVQELLRAGKISFTAALELARRADNMTKSEIAAAAEQVAKLSGGGLKVTAAQVKKAAGVADDGPATNRQKKQFVLDLQSGKFAGKSAEAAKWAAIVAMEVGLGTRTVDSAWSALDRISRGESIRVDFSQYQSEKTTTAAEPVKGQEAHKPAPKAKAKAKKASKKSKK